MNPVHSLSRIQSRRCRPATGNFVCQFALALYSDVLLCNLSDIGWSLGYSGRQLSTMSSCRDRAVTSRDRFSSGQKEEIGHFHEPGFSKRYAAWCGAARNGPRRESLDDGSSLSMETIEIPTEARCCEETCSVVSWLSCLTLCCTRGYQNDRVHRAAGAPLAVQ